MKGSEVHSAVAPINTIYQCQHYFESSVFKTVHYGSETETLKNYVFFSTKKEKILRNTGRQKWSRKMHTLRDNLLRTTVTDAELCESQRNGNNVLSSFLILYERHIQHTQIVGGKWNTGWKKWQKSLARDVDREDACTGPRHSPRTFECRFWRQKLVKERSRPKQPAHKEQS